MILNGGLSGTNLTLYGSIKNPRTFEIQSGQEKRALEALFLKMVGIKSQNSNFLQCVKNLVITWQKPENLLILKTFLELKKEYDLLKVC